MGTKWRPRPRLDGLGREWRTFTLDFTPEKADFAPDGRLPVRIISEDVTKEAFIGDVRLAPAPADAPAADPLSRLLFGDGRPGLFLPSAAERVDDRIEGVLYAAGLRHDRPWTLTAELRSGGRTVRTAALDGIAPVGAGEVVELYFRESVEALPEGGFTLVFREPSGLSAEPASVKVDRKNDQLRRLAGIRRRFDRVAAERERIKHPSRYLDAYAAIIGWKTADHRAKLEADHPAEDLAYFTKVGQWLVAAYLDAYIPWIRNSPHAAAIHSLCLTNEPVYMGASLKRRFNRENFAEWLTKRYGSPDGFNRAAGTAFAGMEALLDAGTDTPAVRYAFRTHQRETLNDFHRLMAKRVRAHWPSVRLSSKIMVGKTIQPASVAFGAAQPLPLRVETPGRDASGVVWRMVPDGDGWLVNAVNYHVEPLEVRIAGDAGGLADLLGGGESPRVLELPPLKPLFFRFTPAP